jgi:hypothetical protein
LAIWESAMTETSPIATSGNSASLLLGRTLDGIPFSTYHLQLILVLGAVGFVEGYDLALHVSRALFELGGLDRGSGIALRSTRNGRTNLEGVTGVRTAYARSHALSLDQCGLRSGS